VVLSFRETQVVVRVGSHGEAKLSVSITLYLIYWYSERCAEWPLCINQEVHEFNSFLSLSLEFRSPPDLLSLAELVVFNILLSFSELAWHQLVSSK